MKKSKKRRIQTDRERMFFAVSVVVITLVLLSFLNARISRIYRTGPLVTDYDITPIIHPTDKPGWKTFVHPDYKFRFQYPQEWQVSLTKTDVRDRGFNLIFTYVDNGKPYRVTFMRGGRGTSAYDSIQRDTVTYGAHTAYKNTYIKNKAPIEQVITFREMDLIEPYIAINIQLPPNNSTKYIDQITRLATSITREE